MTIDIGLLTPDTRAAVQAWLADAANAGYPLVLVSGRRTCAEQNAKYAQGRTTAGPIITDARGCKSWHVLGRAVDFAFQTKGQGSSADYAAVGQLAKKRGFVWGGDFKVSGNPDIDHVEYHPGLTIEQVCPNPDVCSDSIDTTVVLPTPGGTPGAWFDGGCKDENGSLLGPRVRLWPDAHVEFEGEGFPKIPLVRWSKGSPPDGIAHWKNLIYEASDTYGLPDSLIGGFMQVESSGDSNAGSPQGARGLMQLIKSTAESVSGQKNLTDAQILDPRFNIMTGTKYIRQLYDRYKGNLIKVAFGYNAGSAICGVSNAHDGSGPCTPNRFGLRADCYTQAQGTLDYATKVLAASNQALDTVLPLRRRDVSPKPSKATSPSQSGAEGIIVVATLFGIALGVGAALTESQWRS